METKTAKSKQISRNFTPLTKASSYFLFGPRGTGKSTFLREQYQNAKVVDLLDDKTYVSLNNDPARLEPIIQSMHKGEVLIIDEVQKSPALLSKIHQIMESPAFPKIQFILTGSSSRKLKQKGADLLAGRAIIKTMHPFMASELGKHFNLESSLELGLVPVVWSSLNPSETLSSYIALYLREEVKQEQLVRNLEAFSRFLEAMSFSHGEILNLSNVARECSVKRSTIEGYLEVLEDLLLGYRISSFKKRNRKQTIESEKFYFFDTGVFRSLRPTGPLDPQETSVGQALEGLVMQNLKAWIAYRNKNEQIYFWRTKSSNEVDFVIYGPKTFMAIEVKNSNKLSNDHFSGLKSFKEDYPEAECILLYRGKMREKRFGIDCVPVSEFLLSLTV